MDADRLRMAVQFSGDLIGRFPRPAQQHHLRMHFPISGCVMAPSQFTYLALLLRILRRSRFHLLGHLDIPPWCLSLLPYCITNEERSTNLTVPFSQENILLKGLLFLREPL